jgi:hypothetical protein
MWLLKVCVRYPIQNNSIKIINMVIDKDWCLQYKMVLLLPIIFDNLNKIYI